MNYRWDQLLAERHHFPRAVAAVCVLATLFSSQPVFAGSCPVFGPQPYERPTGAPTTVLTVFSAANTTVSYVLQLYNGGLTDAEFDKVSSTTISVNGTQVVAPNDLNQNMAYLEKAVTLSSTNQMTVQVRAKPGAAILLKIV